MGFEVIQSLEFVKLDIGIILEIGLGRLQNAVFGAFEQLETVRYVFNYLKMRVLFEVNFFGN